MAREVGLLIPGDVWLDAAAHGFPDALWYFSVSGIRVYRKRKTLDGLVYDLE